MSLWSGWGDFGYPGDLVFKPQNLAALGIAIAIAERTSYFITRPPEPGMEHSDDESIYDVISLSGVTYNPNDVTCVESTGALSGLIKSLCGFFLPTSTDGLLNLGYSLSSIINHYNGIDGINFTDCFGKAYERIKSFLSIGQFTFQKSEELSWDDYTNYETQINSMIDIMLSEAINDCHLDGNHILFQCAQSIVKEVKYITMPVGIVKWRVGYRWSEVTGTSPRPFTLTEAAGLIKELGYEEADAKISERNRQVKEREQGIVRQAAEQCEEKEWSLYDVSPKSPMGNNDWPGGNGTRQAGYKKDMTVFGLHGHKYEHIEYYGAAQEVSVGAEGGGFIIPDYYSEKLLNATTAVIGKGIKKTSGNEEYCVMQSPDGNFIPSEPGHECVLTGKPSGEWSSLPIPETLVVSVSEFAKLP